MSRHVRSVQIEARQTKCGVSIQSILKIAFNINQFHNCRDCSCESQFTIVCVNCDCSCSCETKKISCRTIFWLFSMNFIDEKIQTFSPDKIN